MRPDDHSEKRGLRPGWGSEFFLEFDTVDDEFQRGFQCGEIWACLADNVIELTAIITASNSEMVMRMTEAAGYSFEGRYLTKEEVDLLDISSGEWLVVVMRANDGREESPSN
jgi:hypothetical protein